MDIQFPFFSRATLYIEGQTPTEVMGTSRLVDAIKHGQTCSLALTKSTQNLEKNFRDFLIPILQRASRCTSNKDTITYYFDEPLESPDNEVEAPQNMDFEFPFFSKATLYIEGQTPMEVRGTSRLVDAIKHGQTCSLALTKSTQNLKKSFRDFLIPILQRASRCTSNKVTITYYFDKLLESPDDEVEASQEIEEVPFFSRATMLIEGGTEKELNGSARLLTAIDKGQNCSLILIKSDIDKRGAFRRYLAPIVLRASHCTSNNKTLVYYFGKEQKRENNKGPGKISNPGGNLAGRLSVPAKLESENNKGPGKISNPGGNLAGRLSVPATLGGRVVKQPSSGPLPPATTNKSDGPQDVLNTLSVEKVIECTKVCEFPGCSQAFPSADSHRNCTRHSECVEATPGTNQTIFSPHNCQDCSDMLNILNEGDSRSLLLDVARYLFVGRWKMARQVFPEVHCLTMQFGEWMRDLEKWYDGETVVAGSQPPTSPGPRRRMTAFTREPPLERFTPVLPAAVLRRPLSPPRHTPPPLRYSRPPPRHLPMSSRYSPPLTGRLSPLKYSPPPPRLFSPLRYGSPPRRSPPRQRRYSPLSPRRSSPPPRRYSPPSPRRSSPPLRCYSPPPRRYSPSPPRHFSPPPSRSSPSRYSPQPRHSHLTRGHSPVPSSTWPKPTASLVANLPEKLQHLLPVLQESPLELVQLLTNEITVSSRLDAQMEQPSTSPDFYEDRYASRSQREHGDRYQDRGYPRAQSPSPQPSSLPRARPGTDHWGDSYKQAKWRSRSNSPAAPPPSPPSKRSRRNPETTTEKLTQQEKDKLLQLVLEDGAGFDVAKLKSLLQPKKSTDSPRDGVNGGGHVKQEYLEGSAHQSRPPPVPYSFSVPPPLTGYTSSVNIPGSTYAPGTGSSYTPGSISSYAAPSSSSLPYPPGLGYATQPMYTPGSAYGVVQAPISLYAPGPAYPNPAYPPPGSAYPPHLAAYGSYQ